MRTLMITGLSICSLLLTGLSACGDSDDTTTDTGTTDTGGNDTGSNDVGGNDVGGNDVGGNDTGTTDTGTTDTGTTDTGTTDTGTTDTGTTDTGTTDTGTTDTGTTDTGTTDTGTTDTAGDTGTTDTAGDTAVSTMGTSIAEARAAFTAAAANGALPLTGSWVITGATVTAHKPLLGDDMGGFFLQAGATGPAIFVVEAGTPPALGATVGLTITELDTSVGNPVVSVYSGLTESGSGDPTSLAQDVSSIDIVAMYDTYANELVTLTGVVAEDFAGAGAGHSGAEVTTTGNATASSALRLRMPATVVAETQLSNGCSFTLTGPLWSFTNNSGSFMQVQPSGITAADFTNVTCAAPQLLNAGASSATQVKLTFDRDIDGGTVMSDGSDFTFDPNNIVATAATVSGAVVTVDLNANQTSASYTVTVGAGVKDVLGAAVDASANSAMFNACVAPAALIINEVDYDQTGTDMDEFIEIFNPTNAAISLTDVVVRRIEGGSSNTGNIDGEWALSGAGSELAAGAYLVVGSSTVIAGLPGGTLSVMLDSSLENGPDGVALVLAPTGGSETIIDSMSYEGDIAGITEGSAADDDTATGSLSRCSLACDAQDNSVDFSVANSPTPGAVNDCP